MTIGNDVEWYQENYLSLVGNSASSSNFTQKVIFGERAKIEAKNSSYSIKFTFVKANVEFGKGSSIKLQSTGYGIHMLNLQM
ncbi:hypothetical protein SAMN02745245_01795 [Anaerosphaera aminiphila DSM 21120]|uniref:Uncharacterized protein n=1 Tax=Anaerosphaera aminiphila DSM 21120 TaxID=1120995 RepID=A0A1M5UJA9_9FIRM|nr:hypothetical protein [Anaerosphaera aminiphila]SHH63162.1 hypothetical protein SAMN02745245_01795 [Anaerosphaera aminiphila DSM 21120]